MSVIQALKLYGQTVHVGDINSDNPTFLPDNVISPDFQSYDRDTHFFAMPEFENGQVNLII